jgi:hypothetical protein
MNLETILVSGATYPLRRELRAAGGVWIADAKGYAATAGAEPALRALAERHGLDVEPFEVNGALLAPLTGDALREHRQARLDRLAERLTKRADAAERRAREARDRVSPHEREFLRLGEPVKRGHHSQRRHEKLIERHNRSFEDQGRELTYAARLRDRAENMQQASVRGDAAKRRQAIRDAASAAIGVGDLVNHVVYGLGTVRAVTAKSFRIHWQRSGNVWSSDKSGVDLVTKGGGDPVPARRFKAGDLVIACRGMMRARGKVLRVTPNGYAVEYVLTQRGIGWSRDYAHRATFAESSLEPREADAPTPEKESA